MKNKFHINTKQGCSSMIMQYSSIRTQFATIRDSINFNDEKEIIYDIKPQYGKGCIKFYKLMGNVMLIIYDTIFNHDMITEFDLSEEYFEIEYCVDGCLNIHEDKVGNMCLSKNELSISMSRETCGRVVNCAGQKYQGISITAEKSAIASYFGSCGIELWEDTIEELENELRNQYYQGINVSPEIANIFLQIFNCSLPEKSKILFFESKVMEILSKIVSYEILGTNKISQLQLDEFEINQIKKIPEVLMKNLYELPTVNILSKQLAINKNKLAKGFKAIYGDTIFRYHRKMCLERAAILLLDTDKSINEIALDVGYSNPSNFCYAFKKEFGVTPLQYKDDSLKLVN
ncbi:helix-turn-helix domain-containing protein [Clostridium sporogenes]